MELTILYGGQTLVGGKSMGSNSAGKGKHWNKYFHLVYTNNQIFIQIIKAVRVLIVPKGTNQFPRGLKGGQNSCDNCGA